MPYTSKETAHVQARVPALWADRLREMAAAGDRTLSAEIRRGLREYLEDDDGRTSGMKVGGLHEPD